MCFIILNDLYMAPQLKIHHLYGTFNFSTQCICMGTGSLLVDWFLSFCGKARPLRRKMVFAVASIASFLNTPFAIELRLISIVQLILTLSEMGPWRHYLETDPDPIAMVIIVELFTHKPSETNTNWHCMSAELVD